MGDGRAVSGAVEAGAVEAGAVDSGGGERGSLRAAVRGVTWRVDAGGVSGMIEVL